VKTRVQIAWHHWLRIRLRQDWRPAVHPGLLRWTLSPAPPPGWYMLTVLYRGDQLRCHGIFQGSQGRVLISGRLRRRLVRIPVGARSLQFEVLGHNGAIELPVLRLVPQPFWRARRLLRRKLLRLHPGYNNDHLSRPLPRLWRDYNRLLGRGNRHLVDYDEWIERCERPLLLQEVAAQNPVTQTPAAQDLAHPTAPPPDQGSAPTWPRFQPGLWGSSPDAAGLQRSQLSLGQQLSGPFVLLDSRLAAESTDAGTWLVLLQVGDSLAPHALRRFAAAMSLHPGAMVFYADEDRITPSGRRHSPQFKPAWNPDLLYADPHYSHSWLIRADLAQQAALNLAAAGEPVSLYGLALEATAACRADQIVHLPEILYHRADRPDETRGDSDSAATLARFLARRGQEVSITPRPHGGHRLHWPLPAPPPLVSVIIPTRDRADLLRCCLDSLEDQSGGGPPTELLLIDNGSQEPDALAYLQDLSQRPQVTVIRRPGPFNFAAFNNEAASLARGEVLAFLNNDVEALQPGWLSAMVAESLRPGIGAVGARLLFEDGTVQHAGVLLGIGGVAGHAHKYVAGQAPGYQLRLQLTHQVSAVTGAALVVRRSLFLEVQGFDAEMFAVNYNDVDLCLRLMARGYRNLFCADAELIHHESRSRGAPSTPEAYAQWQREWEVMQRRWGALLEADPHYNPHLSLLEENFSLALHKDTIRSRAGGWPVLRQD
jgi:GT2 family glycosyltransferase